MTCIVGLESQGKVLMGGDSAGISGTDLELRADPKVFIVGPFIMGFTSSFRMGQLLQYGLVIPPHPKGMTDHHYMTIVFIDAVRECFTQGGWLKAEDNRESGGVFLVGYKGTLYLVHSDFQVGIPAAGFSAVGCGESYALGALCATKNYNISDNIRIRLALEAAESFSSGVRGPFTIIAGAK